VTADAVRKSLSTYVIGPLINGLAVSRAGTSPGLDPFLFLLLICYCHSGATREQCLPLSGPIFVRFRQAEPWLQLSLVEPHRDGDTVRHEHVASLGAITIQSSVADRAAFWEQLIKPLAALGERVDYAAIIAAVAARVPPVTDPERDAIPPPNVKPEATVPVDYSGVLGIEPGFGGALALYRGPGDWAVIDAPTTGTGKQRELDAATFAAWLREHRPVKAFVEHAAALPGQGISSFGHGGMSWG
jgi:hypothetical protein